MGLWCEPMNSVRLINQIEETNMSIMNGICAIRPKLYSCNFLNLDVLWMLLKGIIIIQTHYIFFIRFSHNYLCAELI